MTADAGGVLPLVLPSLICNFVPLAFLWLAYRGAERVREHLSPLFRPAFAAAALAGVAAALYLAFAFAGGDAALVLGPMMVSVAAVGGFLLGGAAATVGAVMGGRAEAWQLVPAVGILVLGLAGLVVLNSYI